MRRNKIHCFLCMILLFSKIIQHVPLFVIPAFSGDRKGDAEMPESHSLLFQGKRFRYFSPFLFREMAKNTEMAKYR